MNERHRIRHLCESVVPLNGEFEISSRALIRRGQSRFVISASVGEWSGGDSLISFAVFTVALTDGNADNLTESSVPGK